MSLFRLASLLSWSITIDLIRKGWNDIPAFPFIDLLSGLLQMDEKNAADRALDISTKAAELGFDWNRPDDVLDKLDEELEEIREALQNGDSIDHVEEEVGDLFFALINFNRKMHIDSNKAFLAGVLKFERRFNLLETIIRNSGRKTSDLTADELEEVWKLVKKGEQNAR